MIDQGGAVKFEPEGDLAQAGGRLENLEIVGFVLVPIVFHGQKPIEIKAGFVEDKQGCQVGQAAGIKVEVQNCRLDSGVNRAGLNVAQKRSDFLFVVETDPKDIGQLFEIECSRGLGVGGPFIPDVV